MIAELECYNCIIKKAQNLLNQYKIPKKQQTTILKKVYQELSIAYEDETAPFLMSKVLKVLNCIAGIEDTYEVPKEKYNSLLLSKADVIFKQIQNSSDKLYTGLQYALVGNYIDFGAMDTVEENTLEKLLEQKDTLSIDKIEFENFKNDLQKAKKLVYITDNAGEIVLDKLLIQVLQELYPKLSICVMVRGAPILNDATIKDAQFIGLSNIVSVIENGTDIPGTALGLIHEGAKEVIKEADLCIAKGQGNFETLSGSGYNIYYFFLCKCELFVKRFQKEQFSSIVANERRIVHNT